MRASIIVPFLNEEEFLPRCVESLLRQDVGPGDYELIFVDNGSTDRSLEVLARIDRVLVLRQPAGNVYAARNRGLAAASGEVVAFTDADCEVPRGWLGSVLNAMSTSRVDVVVGPRIFPRPLSRWLEMFERWENEKAAYALGLRSPYWLAYTNNMAVRRDLLSAVGGFSQEVSDAGDLELVHRLLRARPDLSMSFCEGNAVTHLEIRTLEAWLRKLQSYGATTRAVRKLHDYRDLTLSNRLQVYCRVCRRFHYHALAQMELMAALAVGLIAFSSGRVLGRWN